MPNPVFPLGCHIWSSTLCHEGAVDLEEMLADSSARKAMVTKRR